MKFFSLIHKGFMECLSDNGFEWGTPAWCHVKIYFTENGEIDYWFYNFKKEDNIPKSAQKEFEKLITRFMKSSKIAIKSDSNF